MLESLFGRDHPVESTSTARAEGAAAPSAVGKNQVLFSPRAMQLLTFH